MTSFPTRTKLPACLWITGKSPTCWLVVQLTEMAQIELRYPLEIELN